jgi:hypothetical protein
MPALRSNHAFVTLVLATALTACGGSSHLMAEAPQPVQPLAPSQNAATVVFMRPSGLGFAINFTIVDQSGRFVGEAVAESHFAVTVPPGEYLFIADAENTDVVHANLAPGLIYYINVAAQMGALSAGVNMDPVKPTEPEWREIPKSLAESKRLIAMLSSGQTELNSDPSKLRKMVDDGKRKWAEFSPAEKAMHALELGDGAGLRPSPPPMPQYQTGAPQPQYQPAVLQSPPLQQPPTATPQQYTPAPVTPAPVAPGS